MDWILIWLHIKVVLLVSVASLLAYAAIMLMRGDCIINCDEDEVEANAMTLGRYDEIKPCSSCDCSSHDDFPRVANPRAAKREIKPSGRKHFAED